MKQQIKPWLYANHNREDKEAIILLRKEKVPYENMGPSWEFSTPFLKYGIWKFDGIKGIKDFIKRWKNGNLPPLKA